MVTTAHWDRIRFNWLHFGELVIIGLFVVAIGGGGWWSWRSALLDGGAPDTLLLAGQISLAVYLLIQQAVSVPVALALFVLVLALLLGVTPPAWWVRSHISTEAPPTFAGLLTLKVSELKRKPAHRLGGLTKTDIEQLAQLDEQLLQLVLLGKVELHAAAELKAEWARAAADGDGSANAAGRHQTDEPNLATISSVTGHTAATPGNQTTASGGASSTAPNTNGIQFPESVLGLTAGQKTQPGTGEETTTPEETQQPPDQEDVDERTKELQHVFSAQPLEPLPEEPDPDLLTVEEEDLVDVTDVADILADAFIQKDELDPWLIELSEHLDEIAAADLLAKSRQIAQTLHQDWRKTPATASAHTGRRQNGRTTPVSVAPKVNTKS